MAINAALIPYSVQLWDLYLYCWLIGLSAGAWNNANNVWLIEMWQKNSAPILQLSQFMYGIGTIIGPLIDRPYLTGEIGNSLNEMDVSNSTLLPLINTSIINHEDIDRRSKLKTPFLISGVIQLIGIYLISKSIGCPDFFFSKFRSYSYGNYVFDQKISASFKKH